jgi:hypothetical protein
VILFERLKVFFATARGRETSPASLPLTLPFPPGSPPPPYCGGGFVGGSFLWGGTHCPTPSEAAGCWGEGDFFYDVAMLLEECG